MRKSIYLLSSICIILLLTAAAIWLVDATVQIDDDYAVLCAFVLVLDSLLAGAAYWGYKKLIA